MVKEGANRKASQKPADSSKPTRPLQKRVKASEPKSKPEPEHLVEEPRKLKDLWKAAFPVGKGWHGMDSVHKEFKWDFLNLERAFEENGRLNHEVLGNDDNVYLFGTIECHCQRKDEVEVPVLVAVVSPYPPSDELRIKPLDGAEVRVTMKELNMDWIPCIPLYKRDSDTQVIKYPQIFVLGCTERRSDALNYTKDESFVKLQYFFPCLDDHKEEEDDCRARGEVDEVAKFIIEEMIEGDDELSPIVKAGLKEYVEDKLFEAKRNGRENKDSSNSVFSFVQAMIEDGGFKRRSSNKGANTLRRFSREEGFGSRRIYKFYPVQTPETPDISRAKYRFINKYYGKPHEVP
ncbi:protein HEAT INTOLERANT 4-like [Pyrus communis]|uniref:protein HEAT INTOLERANT 4-like n=1 Tax=Pyrus communis TaxID=23211 RepID=UPI0035BF9149